MDQRELASLDRLSSLLDTRFRVPGTGIRLGLDALVGLVPGVGDTITLLPSAYMIMRAGQHGADKRTVARMMGNTAIDWLIGAIPLVGDIFDIGFRSNRRNYELLRDALERKALAASSDRAGRER